MITTNADISQEWEARLPGLSRLWAITRGLPQIRIAVLDGPIEPTTAPVSFITPSGVAEHGTLVASIMGGSRISPQLGLAPGCTVLGIPIFEETPSGELKLCSQEALAEAITEAVSAKARIINISASQQADLLSLSPTLSGALQKALAANILIVAAAGNGGCACDVVPASCPGVLAVGAHDQNQRPLPGSNWGPGQRSGILAPGFALPGACLNGGVCRGTGTSFAAATVSGIAALLMSVEAQADRPISGEAIRKLLIDTSDPCPREEVELCGPYLSGRLNVNRALDRLLATLPAGVISIRNEPIDKGSTMPGVSIETGQKEISSYPESAELFKSTSSGGLGPAHEGCACGGKCNGDCGCGGTKTTGAAIAKSSNPQLVYAIGRLGISFPSQVRRDALWRKLNPVRSSDSGASISREIDLKPIDAASLETLFGEEPWQAQAVYWTLSRTEVPMYAIVPGGAFAAETYKWLVEEWADKDVELVSLSGAIVGQVTLYDGMIVDAVMPDLRGMYSWETKRYTEALLERLPQPDSGSSSGEDGRRLRIERFLRKIYFSIRNRGLSPEERALNAAATNAFNLTPVILEAGSQGLALKDISVERSPINRPGSEYYDVLLTFFKPDERLNVSPLVARFTVDVSDIVPVVVGEPVSWYDY
ncbi:S8 family serine peptidase [Methylobacterium currus]|uniref:S8 family serine peptidase n=1 Tax=Methylobacterium currus TaxID=2051553 RepID=UPI001E498B8B|nr:S8 family serine peptidase [Methylobacterium currus]UHC14358.1 S8 family serine peptidase [Methylobacterium currus]